MRPDKRLLFAAMLVAVPCPSFFLFCNGLLSVSALGLGVAQFVGVAMRDPVALGFAIGFLLYAAAYGLCLYWLAGWLARRLSSYRVLTARRAWGLLIVALFVLTILPVYSFDCMDGASIRWCNWYELHVGWFAAGAACGDFHR